MIMKKWNELIIYAEVYLHNGQPKLLLRKTILDKEKIEFVLTKILNEDVIPATIEVRDFDVFMEKLKKFNLIEKK